MISARNFGSHTCSAFCFDVIGSVAPRASAKSSTGMRQRLPWCITSNHQGCSQRGLARQPFCLQIFRTAIRSSFRLRHSRGCSSTNPVEDVCGMEPPSSDAEALRRQETAQVRAANGLLVAADEFGDLERRHQAIRQSAGRGRPRPPRIARRSQYAPNPGTCASSWLLRPAVASNVLDAECLVDESSR